MDDRYVLDAFEIAELIDYLGIDYKTEFKTHTKLIRETSEILKFSFLGNKLTTK
jgi:hypothetical protein